MNQTKKSIRLLRDVEANMVPSGDKVTLTEGNLVQITQSLGGNHTVITVSYTHLRAHET